MKLGRECGGSSIGFPHSLQVSWLLIFSPNQQTQDEGNPCREAEELQEGRCLHPDQLPSVKEELVDQCRGGQDDLSTTLIGVETAAALAPIWIVLKMQY